MKNKTTLAVVLLIMSIVIVGQFATAEDSHPPKISMASYGQDDGTPQKDKAEVNIKAPDKVNVGDVIIVDLSESLGGGFDYEVSPMPPGLMTFDNGKVIVCGTGDKNTTFTFMVSCALNGDSDLQVHKIRVVGSQPQVPPTPGNNLVSKVKEWAELVESDNKHDDAIKLAQSFSSVASIIDQDTFDTAQDLIRATATSNRDALNGNLPNWAPLLDGLMSELRSMQSTGLLPNVMSHAPVWRQVAQGLKEYAETL